MEFADLDDDLFSEERNRNNIDEEYSARYCENYWFLEVTPNQFVSDEDKLGILKHMADYLFFKKEHNDAYKKYDEILGILPSGNTTLRRECYECIARCFIKMGKPERGIDYANKLHATSKTLEQATVSCSVLIDVNIAAKKYCEALESSQMMISIHPYNADAWLKLACIYANLYNIVLPGVKNLLTATFPYQMEFQNEKLSSNASHFKSRLSDVQKPKPVLENSSENESLTVKTNSVDEASHAKGEICQAFPITEAEKGIQIVCACLYRSYMVLKRTEGTTFGFALDSSLRYQKKILIDMDTLLDEKLLYSLKCRVNRCDHVYNGDSPAKETTPEFVDRGSSKYRSDETEVDVDVSVKSFEMKWFNWIK